MKEWFARQAIKVALLAAFVGLIWAGASVYRFFRGDVWIYVDNGSGQAVEVRIDGAVKATVEPNATAVIRTSSGERAILATSGGKSVFDSREKLESGDPNYYVLNVGEQNRYWIQTVQYGASFPNIMTYYSDADRYRQTAARIALVPPSAFFHAKVDHVLEDPPEKVKAKYSDSRRVLRRLDRSEYELLQAARDKREVTSEELQRLESLVDRLLKD